jgi:hypothetical protein
LYLQPEQVPAIAVVNVAAMLASSFKASEISPKVSNVDGAVPTRLLIAVST